MIVIYIERLHKHFDFSSSFVLYWILFWTLSY